MLHTFSVFTLSTICGITLKATHKWKFRNDSMYKSASGKQKNIQNRKTASPSITVSTARERSRRQTSLRIVSAVWWATRLLALLGFFFLAPTMLGFVLLFYFKSSDLPGCSPGSRTWSRMSSFVSRFLAKYFICVEQRLMNCTSWNGRKTRLPFSKREKRLT